MAVTEFGAQTKALPTPSSAEAPTNQYSEASTYMMPAIHNNATMTQPKPKTDSSRGLMRSAKGPTKGEPSTLQTAGFRCSMMVCMEPVHLIVGDDEFLAERARRSIQKAVAEETGEQPELKILRAAEVTEWELIEATSPSLFGETRVIVISDTERIGSALIKLIV